MFFVLSKVLFFLLHPLSWIAIALICYRFSKTQNAKKTWKIAAVLLAICFTNSAIYRFCLINWQPLPSSQHSERRYSAGILLTGMCFTDSKGNTFFGSNADRFIQTAKLYHSGTINKIIISGGDGSLKQDKPKEADFLYREMLAQAVPDSNILVENRSRNTDENARFSKKLLDSLSLAPPYLLITSARHMKRAVACFQKAGVTVDMHPANYIATENAKDLKSFVIPDLSLLNEWQYLLKEMVGYFVYRYTGKA